MHGAGLTDIIRTMALETAAILMQLDDVLARCHASATSALTPREMRDRGVGGIAGKSAACLAVIDRIAPGSSYQQSAANLVEAGNLGSSITLAGLVGVVRTLRADVEAGYTKTLEELIHADVFADFLTMAEELLAKHFKDAAAVITGSVLEEHLRKLAAKAGLNLKDPTGKPLRAARLNDDLKAAAAYSALEHKAITAWLAIRNDAAHGNYAAYDEKRLLNVLGG